MRALACILTLTIACSLAACSNSSSQTEKRVEFWTLSLKPTFTSYMETTLAAFSKLHPEITVDWIDVPGSAIEDKTLSAVLAGTPPDLVNLNPDFSQRLGSKGALAQLDTKLSSEFLSRYFPSALDACRIKGHLVGLPWYLSTQVAVYNRSALASASLATLPSSYRELASHAQAFKSAGVLPFLPNFGDGNRILELLALDGVTLLTPDRRLAAFNTPEGRESFEFWSGLFTRQVLPKEAISLDNREIVDRFQAGQSAVLPAGPQFLKTIRDNAPQLYSQVEVAPQLSGRSGRIGVGVMNLVVPATSLHQKEALELAIFMTNAANQLEFCKLAAILPSVQSAASDPFFSQLGATASVEDRARHLAAEQLKRSVLLVPPMPHHNALKKTMNAALQRVALGQQSSEQALKQAEADWNRILASP